MLSSRKYKPKLLDCFRILRQEAKNDGEPSFDNSYDLLLMWWSESTAYSGGDLSCTRGIFERALMGIINYILPEETMIGALNKIYMGPNMLRIIKASFNDFNRDGMLNAKYLMDDPCLFNAFSQHCDQLWYSSFRPLYMLRYSDDQNNMLTSYRVIEACNQNYTSEPTIEGVSDDLTKQFVTFMQKWGTQYDVMKSKFFKKKQVAVQEFIDQPQQYFLDDDAMMLLKNKKCLANLTNQPIWFSNMFMQYMAPQERQKYVRSCLRQGDWSVLSYQCLEKGTIQPEVDKVLAKNPSQDSLRSAILYGYLSWEKLISNIDNYMKMLQGFPGELLSLYLKEENREVRYLPALIVQCMKKDILIIQSKFDKLVDVIKRIAHRDEQIVKMISKVTDLEALKWLVNVVLKINDNNLNNAFRARLVSRDSELLPRMIKSYLGMMSKIHNKFANNKIIRNRLIMEQLKHIIEQLNRINAVNASVVIKAYEMIMSYYEGNDYPKHQKYLMKVLKGVDVCGIECEQDCPPCEKILMCTLRLMYYNGLEDLSDAKTEIQEDCDFMRGVTGEDDNAYALSGNIFYSLAGRLNGINRDEQIVKMISKVTDLEALKCLVNIVLKINDNNLNNAFRARLVSRDSNVLYQIIDKIYDAKKYKNLNSSKYNELMRGVNEDNGLTKEKKESQLKALKRKKKVLKKTRNQLKHIIEQLNRINAVNASVVIKAYEMIMSYYKGNDYPKHQKYLMKVLKGVDVCGIECEQDCPPCEKILMCTLRLMYYNGLEDLSDAKTEIQEDCDFMRGVTGEDDNAYALSGNVFNSLAGRLNDLDRGNDPDGLSATRG